MSPTNGVADPTGIQTTAPPAQTEVDAATAFAEHRATLLSVAYRILGRHGEAEDVVQEAWLRWSRVDPAEVQDPRAFLVRVTTRLALDRLRRIKARREDYVGQWLPEPLLTTPDVADRVELAETISMALLVVLETLSPLERAVFVLREAFGYSHAEIASILDRSETAVRQLAARARTHVNERRPRFQSDIATRRQVTERFLAACSTGDTRTLLDVLAPEVVLVADSGGRTLAPRQPVRGADRVARFLLSVTRPQRLVTFLASAGQEPGPDLEVGVAEVNGGPAIVASAAGRIVTALLLDVVDGQVAAVHLITNPDKLASLAA